MLRKILSFGMMAVLLSILVITIAGDACVPEAKVRYTVTKRAADGSEHVLSNYKVRIKPDDYYRNRNSWVVVPKDASSGVQKVAISKHRRRVCTVLATDTAWDNVDKKEVKIGEQKKSNLLFTKKNRTYNLKFEY